MVGENSFGQITHWETFPLDLDIINGFSVLYINPWNSYSMDIYLEFYNLEMFQVGKLEW